MQPPSETDRRWPVPFGDPPVSNAGQPPRVKGGGLLAAASCLLLLLAAAQGYVSFRAQYAFVDHAKHTRIPSVLEALGLDTGAVIFALLALSLARRGRRGTVERVLNVACALGSLTMNLLAANLTSPRSVTVWVLPSALYALASDRLIAVVRRWVQASDPAAQDRAGRLGMAGGRRPGALGAAADLRRAGDAGRLPSLGAGRGTSRAGNPRRDATSGRPATGAPRWRRRDRRRTGTRRRAEPRQSPSPARAARPGRISAA